MKTVIFVHGMFQNPVSWCKWTHYFSEKGHECVAPAWPLHAGNPLDLRENPPEGLGDLRLHEVIEAIEAQVRRYDLPIDHRKPPEGQCACAYG